MTDRTPPPDEPTQGVPLTNDRGFVGTTVGDGRYRLDAHIATGGMGSVWRAHDTVLERPVAVKLLRPELADDASFRARFESEARNAARVQHPGIASVYDYGQSDSVQQSGHRAYLVMELVDGRPLDELFAAGRLGTAQLVDIVAQTADVLQAAHDQGLVHRDVKPANILVTPTGQVKVTDFGIAKALADASITDTGMVLGTPHYLSPEQAEGRPAQPASDVYALGVVLYEGLAGRRPFVRDTPVATALAHLRDRPPELPDDVPDWLATITMSTLAKDPADRPSSAAAMAVALREHDASSVGGTTATALIAGGAAAGLAAAAGAAATPVSETRQVTSAVPLGATGSTLPPDLDPDPDPEPEPEPRRNRFLPVLAAVAALLLLAGVAGALLVLQGGDGDSSPSESQTTETTPDDGPKRKDRSPTKEPTTEATTEPTIEPTTQPTTTAPTTQPTTKTPKTPKTPKTTKTTQPPTTQPTTEPTTEPTTQPTTTAPTTPPATTPTAPGNGNSGGNGGGNGNGLGGATP